MRPLKARPEPVHFKFHRLKAALSLQHRQFQDFCSSLPVSHRHAQFVLTGARTGSAALLDAIRRELGESAWRFAIGEVNTLTDEGADDAAA
jgi:hypothetical protein